MCWTKFWCSIAASKSRFDTMWYFTLGRSELDLSTAANKWPGAKNSHQGLLLRYCTMFGVTWSLLTTSSTCYATEDAVRIVNSFITIPITRNYNHSQLFITLCHIYTAYNRTRSWLQSLITLLHWLTSQLSITVSHYHTLYIFTLRNSRRELTPRIHFLRLLLNNWLVGLLLTNWFCIGDGFQDNSSERTPPKTVAIVVLIA
jgi:hypothetical protein